jgi:hypothetical protein
MAGPCQEHSIYSDIILYVLLTGPAENGPIPTPIRTHPARHPGYGIARPERRMNAAVTVFHKGFLFENTHRYRLKRRCGGVRRDTIGIRAACGDAFMFESKRLSILILVLRGGGNEPARDRRLRRSVCDHGKKRSNMRRHRR